MVRSGSRVDVSELILARALRRHDPAGHRGRPRATGEQRRTGGRRAPADGARAGLRTGREPGHDQPGLAGAARAGLIESRGRAGSFVRRDAAEGPAMRMRGMAAPDDPVRLDLSRGTPDPLLLPPLGPALSRVSARADAGSYQAEPVIPGLAAVLRTRGRARPSRSWSSTARSTRSRARSSRSCASATASSSSIRVPAVPRPARPARRRGGARRGRRARDVARGARRPRCAGDRSRCCCSRAPRTRRARR